MFYNIFFIQITKLITKINFRKLNSIKVCKFEKLANQPIVIFKYLSKRSGPHDHLTQ